jgi:cytochrome P450
VKLDRAGSVRSRDHLAFSMGPRLCAGAALARAEIQEVVAALLEWFPDLHRDEGHPESEQRYSGFALRSWSPAYARFTPVGP